MAALIAGVTLAAVSPPQAYAGSPTITVWYGHEQHFGQLGNPQQWINILGSVSPPQDIASLTYTLNAGPPLPLSIGPDSRRLLSPGDFNVEIDINYLVDGQNLVAITALDNAGASTTETVTAYYTAGTVWPEDYAVDWSTVTNIQDVAQVTDGLWAIEGDAIRPVVTGYDRAVAVGDITWDDYEAKALITLHGAGRSGAAGSRSEGGYGLWLRWPGHSAWDDAQPRWGWHPSGANCWYHVSNQSLFIGGEHGICSPACPSQDRVLELGTPYWFKMRTQSVPDEGTYYACRVWPVGGLEPATWDVEGMEGPSDVPGGSCLIVAHLVDISIGTIEIQRLPDPNPPLIADVEVQVSDSDATISWTTNEVATGSVAYGLTDAYEIGTVEHAGYELAHSITLTDLTIGEEYHFQITSVDVDRNPSTTADQTFVAGVEVPPPVITSDDFGSTELDPSVWTFVDPLADADLLLTGSHAQIVIAATGEVHDAWTGINTLPRLMQQVENPDFVVEAKFDSPLSAGFQSQGILAEQDPLHVVRVEFHYYDGQTKLFAATILDDTATTHLLQPVAATPPMRLRVSRSGPSWNVAYSVDQDVWINAATFSGSLFVNSIGVFAGNSADTAHTASVDYFYDVLTDTDGDGWVDVYDNCPTTPNEDQADIDGDGYGDACDGPFDADHDGDVDADDLADHVGCLWGPGAAVSPACADLHDSDADQDVDLADFFGFQRSFGT